MPLKQDVWIKGNDAETSTKNSTDTNLASDATFEGTAEDTHGINGIQAYHFADQPCTVYIEQGLDGTNFDIVDSFECLANTACTRTFISVAPYYRARVTNTGNSTTTSIRMATGKTPIIFPLPRGLAEDGRLKVETHISSQEDRHAVVSPIGSLNVNTNARLVGTNFDGTNKDTNFWTETVTGSGAVTQSGKITLSTGSNANSTAIYDSVRRARFVAGSAQKFTGAFKFVTVGETDNIRRCGAYDANNGGFFQLDGSIFSLGVRSGGADTLINSGNFNGDYGISFEIEADTPYKFEAEWTELGATYYINGKVLHTATPPTPPTVLTLPIRFENLNDNGNISDIDFICYGVVILREGELITNSTYKYIAGASTTVCKYGAGTLHKIVNNDNSGSCVVYDNTAGSGTIIASPDLSKVLGTITFDAPFSNGLTITTVGSGAKVTLVYE